MKERKIEIIRVVDEDDNTVSDLFAIEFGTRPDRIVTEDAVNAFLGEYQSDGDELCYKEVIDSLCRHQQIEMFGYTFFFVETILYEKQNITTMTKRRQEIIDYLASDMEGYSYTKEQLEAMDNDELFDAYANWHGLIGWSYILKDVVESIYGVTLV